MAMSTGGIVKDWIRRLQHISRLTIAHMTFGRPEAFRFLDRGWTLRQCAPLRHATGYYCGP